MLETPTRPLTTGEVLNAFLLLVKKNAMHCEAPKFPKEQVVLEERYPRRWLQLRRWYENAPGMRMMRDACQVVLHPHARSYGPHEGQLRGYHLDHDAMAERYERLEEANAILRTWKGGRHSLAAQPEVDLWTEIVIVLFIRPLFRQIDFNAATSHTEPRPQVFPHHLRIRCACKSEECPQE